MSKTRKMSGIDIASRKWKYAHATLKDKSHMFGRQSKPCWDGNIVDSKIMKYRHYHRWSLNVFDINLQNALIFRRHWKLISTLMPHAISIVQAAWGKGGWWIWSIRAPQLGDPLQHRKCRNFQGLAGFLLSKIHAHSTPKCGRNKFGAFFSMSTKNTNRLFPKLLQQYWWQVTNCEFIAQIIYKNLRLFFCRIFGNKMTWGSKPRLFSLTKMHNSGHLSKLGYLYCFYADFLWVMEAHIRVHLGVRTIPLGHEIISSRHHQKPQ